MFEDGENECDRPLNPVDVSDVQVALDPEYQRYEYGGVPVVGADIVSVDDCPLSMTELEDVGAEEAVKAEFTTSCEVAVYTTLFVEALSVSFTQ